MSPLDVLPSDVRGQGPNALRFNKGALGEISRLGEEEVCINARRQVGAGTDRKPVKTKAQAKMANAEHQSRSAGERIKISHVRQDLLTGETLITNVLEGLVSPTVSKRSERSVWTRLVLEGPQ